MEGHNGKIEVERKVQAIRDTQFEDRLLDTAIDMMAWVGQSLDEPRRLPIQ